MGKQRQEIHYLKLKRSQRYRDSKSTGKGCGCSDRKQRPGVMKRLGLDYETLKEVNPALIYCSLTAFGQTGPYSQKPGFDMMGQALSGMMSIPAKGWTAIKHGIALADYFAGFNVFASVLTAFIIREEPEKASISMFPYYRA